MSMVVEVVMLHKVVLVIVQVVVVVALMTVHW